MQSIDILVAEHENIKQMLDVIRHASLAVLKGAPVEVNDFREMIAFIRLYADQTHHGKEEAFLFKEMVSELGGPGENLVRHGMLVEHDLARLFVANLEAALNEYEKAPSDELRLDILVAAGSYRELLTRHITKENGVVFPFGERNLSEEALGRVTEGTDAFENDDNNKAVRDAQLEVLEKLTKRYIG